MKYGIVLTVIGSLLATNAAEAAQPSNRPSTASRASSEEAAVKQVLSRYKAAIEKLDATGTEQLFAPSSAIFETGGSEGTYTNYLAHHLGPELKEVKRFSFSDYKVDVRFEGAVALATETYNYRVETKSGETAERRGVATSVLKKIGGQWKILSMHNSARKPRGS
jgi:ketosteroid isomerase-like protein